MEQLINKRRTVKANISRIFNYCNNPEAAPDQILARAQNLDKYFELFEEIQSAIEADVEERDMPQQEQYRMQLEAKYYGARAIIEQQQHNMNAVTAVSDNNEQSNQQLAAAMDTLVRNQSAMGLILERLTENTSTPLAHEHPDAVQPQSAVRLPSIKLPEFDGTYGNWIHFRDMFEALINNRNNLSDIEKMEYLKAHVKGDALSLIKHLNASNENYTVAWEIIKQKYNNSAHIKRDYLKLLLDQPPMKGPYATELKRVYNNTNECINALKAMKEPVDKWDSVLLYNLERKLDVESQTLWCRSATEQPTFTNFMKFMESRLYELENIQANKPNTTQYAPRHRSQTNIHATAIKGCSLCKETHLLFNCNKFKQLAIGDRIDVVRKGNLCYNCLRSDHFAANCKASGCRKCGKKHNTLVHKEQENTPDTSELQKVNVNAVYMENENQLTVLPTATALILGANNLYHPCRLLLDTGSQATLISESCVQRLNIKRKFDKTQLCGVGGETLNYSRGKVEIVLGSQRSNNTITITALCLRKLTQQQPSVKFSPAEIEYFRNLPLADTNCNQPNQIDIILGADVFNKYYLNQRIVHPSGRLSAFNTIFGWAIIGNVSLTQASTITIAHTTIDLSNQLQQFWAVEELHDNQQFLTEDEKQAEDYYQQTVTRDETGRYIVRLPFKSQIPEFGETRKQALKRMHNMERRFLSNIGLQQNYTNFMEEYLTMSHMETIPQSQMAKYYLPHHAVEKMDSTTTKLRVVFDGSAKASNGRSLNQELLTGPQIQSDIFTLLVRFRKYKFAMTGDIEKMYRQVLIHPDDRAYQCIVWRSNNNTDMITYQLKTITYGTSAAPFLAIRTLNQIAMDNEQQHPSIAQLIKDSFYVDDFMSSTNNLQAAITIRQELSKVLLQAGMHIRKWCSNSSDLLITIDAEDQELSDETVIDDSQTVKTLGLRWNTRADIFLYNVKLPAPPIQVTKRQVLSTIARVFDPLGCLAPVVITLKIYMQKLWLKGIEWDSQLPDDLDKKWKQIYENINDVTNIAIPRWLNYANENLVELHGYADASELAYAAVVYIKVTNENGDVTTQLVAAKTRVAPVKQISLPRLELCACQLLVKLMTKVKKALNIDNIREYGWTDSTIVLSWLAEHPRKWKSFVANRTSYIIDKLPTQFWHHVASAMNPADLATRGLSPKELKASNLWWYGPPLLRENKYNNKEIYDKPDPTELEIRKKAIFHINNRNNHDIFYRFSKFSKLIRITAIILRFTKNCKTKKLNKQTGYLTTTELQDAHDILVKQSQQISYIDELKMLAKGQLPSTHGLSAVAPFVDERGLLRVGGRLVHANISFSQKHPLILHKDNILTKIIIEYYHLKFLHAGTRQLQYLLGLKYYIPSVIYEIKRCVYKCPRCMRYRNKTYEQQMGNLPRARLEAVTAFHNTGVDFAGPMLVRSWKGRGSRQYKCWIAVFVCLATKAIHLEAVTELSTDAFLATLRRFVARRGKPAHIYSDNGTNFVGCNNKLKELHQFIHKEGTKEAVNKETAESCIQWHFSPPFGPNFGGIWEAGVKSIKYHLNRVLGQSAITYEELNTILCQIEACLNSRPLSAKFEGDADPLTPGHLLIFKSMEAVPDRDVATINTNRRTRWQYLQKLVQSFWKKWSTEYISQLQARPKWKTKLDNLQLEDLVIVKDDLSPPSKWLMGRVIEVHPGQDELVRVVTVKTHKGTLKRPISKLCPLIVDY